MSGPTTNWDVYESPLGSLVIQARPGGLCGLFFPGRARDLGEHDRDRGALATVTGQLDEYFAGRRKVFDLPLDLVGTPFQQRVWEQLREIPYGTTITYTELAHAVGRPDIVRAVAGVVGKTPVPIIIPCHRVIAASGALTGYLGGIERKQALLELERGVVLGATQAPSPSRQLALL